MRENRGVAQGIHTPALVVDCLYIYANYPTCFTNSASFALLFVPGALPTFPICTPAPYQLYISCTQGRNNCKKKHARMIFKITMQYIYISVKPLQNTNMNLSMEIDYKKEFIGYSIGSLSALVVPSSFHFCF